MKEFLKIFEANGYMRDFRRSFPFLWRMSVFLQMMALVYVIGGLIFGSAFDPIGTLILWGLAVCILLIVCSMFWMAAQPNRGVAVLSPWTMLKDLFETRRPNG